MGLTFQAASDAGIDIRGACFTAGGEPTTAARRAAIEAGQRALRMHAGRGTLVRPIVAQQQMFLGKDAEAAIS